MTKVCILAAGKGSRLGPRTAFFPKTMLRVGNVAIISHIIEYFPEDYEFIIVIGYLGDILKQYVEIAHPDRKVTFITQEELNGPGGALLLCKDYLEDDSFYIWTSDTLVGSFACDERYSWIGTHVGDSANADYSCVSFDERGAVTLFHEKNHICKTNAPYIGVAFINNPQEFWEGMLKNPVRIGSEYQISAGFSRGTYRVKDFRVWHDTGNDTGLLSTRNHYKALIVNLDKSDEEIYFLDDRVIKYFYHEKIIENRVKRSLSLNDTVPKILDSSRNFYSYEFVLGDDFFKLQDKEKYVKELLDYSCENLWSVKILSSEEKTNFDIICEKFYKQKTEARIKDLYLKLDSEDSEDIINGVLVPKISDLLSKVDWKEISNGMPSGMHGDFNFSNILKVEDNVLHPFKFIDHRQDFGGLLEYGDLYYDLGKFLAGIWFPHDQVKKGQLHHDREDNRISLYAERNECYIECERIFWDFVRSKGFNEKKIKVLTAIIFLNMSPLHEDPIDEFLYYYGKMLLNEHV